MPTSSLKNLLRSSGHALVGKTGSTNVIVDLRTADAEPACLTRLRKLGLTIRGVTDNKVIGSIAAEQVGALRRDADVREVEESTTLKAH